MTPPSTGQLFDVIDATWPAARKIETAGWCLREGLGGGSRVSAATATIPAPDIAALETAQAGLGQTPLAMLRPGEDQLDARLAAAGYAIKDPVTLYLAPVETLAKAPPPVTTFQVAWPPVVVQTEIWESGGIGPERLAVMARAGGPKTTLLGRVGDQPAGTAFVAIDGPVAMLHALEILPDHRRKGLARHMMQGAAIWAHRQGAAWVCVLVTKANAPANALYASLGMKAVGGYHYRTR